LADDRPAPRELDPAEVPVGEDGGERSERLAETPAQGGPHGTRIAATIAFLKPRTEDRGATARLASARSVFDQEVPMEGEFEKFNRPDEDDEVEAHKFEPDDTENEKFETPTDEDEDVEAHKF
jgi:hypothetical protein